VKSIVDFVVKNKLAVWLLTIIVTFSGLYSATKMKMETIPDISIPYLIVMGVYPGATAEQVMNDITIPAERVFENLKGVKTVMSNSSSSYTSITVEYDYEVDLDEAKRELESAMDTLTLPSGAQDLSVMTFSMNMVPVMALSVSSETEDIVELTSTVEDILLPKLQKIDGVASAAVSGQHIEQVEITYLENKLAQYGVTEQSIKDMIQASDIYMSLGIYEFTEAEQAIAVDGKLTTLDELKNLLIPVTPSAENPVPFVPLSEFANIELVGKVESISRTNGQDAIAIQITKGQDANTVTVVDAVKEIIEQEQERLPGLVIETTLDQGEPITEAVYTMVEKAIFGGAIAILIILLFLRDIKSTIISIISIPVSIFLAILVLNWLDITLNIMTLGAITVAIGRVIDDSIVVVENIYRRLHLKEEPLTGRALIREATIEMFKPILSSTLVTVAVFAPLVFVGGMIGELFLPFALTMALALIASLIVAITIVPALSHFLFKKKLYASKEESKHKEVGKLALWYKNVLNTLLNRKVITLLVSVALLVGSLMLARVVGLSFLGSEEEKMMIITYAPKAGELKEDTVDYVTTVEQELLKRDDVEIVQLSITESTDAMSMMMGGGGSLLYVIFDDSITNFPEVKEEVLTYLGELDHPGRWSTQDMTAMMGSMGGNELQYTLYSDSLDDLKTSVSMVEEVLASSSRLKDVSSSKEESYEEFTFKVEQDNLLQYGLTTAQIIMAIYGESGQETITTLKNNGQDIDVIVKKDVSIPLSLDDMLNKDIPTALGITMKLKDLVEVEEGVALNTLARSEGQFYATVSATIIDADISKASTEVAKEMDKLTFPKGVELGESGVMDDLIEAFTQLGIAMLAAILIVYFILVVTFGEGLAPFVILLSLPFTVIGAVVGLYIAGETISVTVLMGMLMLIGIVVTNAIVLVDRIIRKETEGLELREAILEAGSTRLRPILMTAIATIGALIPLAIGNGAGGGLISKGMAITVIGGLASSTLLTLVVVPIMYEVLSKMLKKNRRNVLDN